MNVKFHNTMLQGSLFWKKFTFDIQNQLVSKTLVREE